ncbi:anti-sigma factor family protein [Elioraea sp.]|uniref:anti-sigma factor family protein n=1 Tax=Elioraea sp. TaxID=2185103 RepID=UPI003F71885F
MLTCREVTERASEYLDGNLPFGRRLAFRLHLLMCRHCRRYVDQLAGTIALVRAAGQEAADPEAADRIVAALKQSRAGARPSE